MNSEVGALRQMPTQIVIVDDHPLFRGAMAQALQQGLEGIAAPVSILQAGDFNALQAILSEQPDIDLVLLDLAMPGVSGFSGLVRLRGEHSHVPVMIVSASDDAVTVERALGLGASGFVSKSSSIETIRDAIKSVMQGDVWRPEGLESLDDEDDEMADLVKRMASLTPQQSRVLSMIAQGLLNKQIAYELGVSEATVKAHVSAVLQKLNVDSRTQAVIVVSKLSGDNVTA